MSKYYRIEPYYYSYIASTTACDWYKVVDENNNALYYGEYSDCETWIKLQTN